MPTPPLPTPPPPPSASSCASDSSWRDSDGDRCSHYDDKPEWCGFEDSQARCCACKTSASQPCATQVEDSSCARGVRVARGPHWRWGDQDGGVGGVGTVTGRADESGWCTVTWDQGGSNAYRVGSFSMFDLCRWTPGPSGTPPPTVGRQRRQPLLPLVVCTQPRVARKVQTLTRPTRPVKALLFLHVSASALSTLCVSALSTLCVCACARSRSLT